MTEFLKTLTDILSAEAITFIAAMIPFTELRGAIPFGIGALGLTATSAYIWAVLGNIVPNFILLALLEPITNFVRAHSKPLNKLITKIFDKTRAKHSAKLDKYGAIFLVLFVAIPLPGSGSWSAALIAFLFGIPYWRAIGLISLGIAIAGLIVTFAWEGLASALHAFF